MNRMPACLGLALLAAACAPGVDTTPPKPSPGVARGAPPTPGSLVGTEWELALLDHAPTAPGTRATLQFDAGRLGGYGSCNWYGATWTARDGGLRIGAVESTARGCPDPAMAQEVALVAALGRVAASRRSGERLQLVDDVGNTLLEWTPRTIAAMAPADLVGTRWRWTAAAPVGVRAVVLEFVDGESLRGFAGCRGYAGTYRARGDRIGITSLAMDDTECHEGTAAGQLEGAFLEGIGELETWRLAGDRLQLGRVDGGVMEFVRER